MALVLYAYGPGEPTYMGGSLPFSGLGFLGTHPLAFVSHPQSLLHSEGFARTICTASVAAAPKQTAAAA